MGIWRTITTVLWAFFGIRRGADHRAAEKQLKPIQIIAVAVGIVIVFIIGLIILVNSITANVQ